MTCEETMRYELWDLVSGNLIGTYPTQAEALACVRQFLTDEGREYVRDIALDGPDAEGKRRQIAEGDELADLALTEAPAA
jgi:hypothetical protein